MEIVNLWEVDIILLIMIYLLLKIELKEMYSELYLLISNNYL